MIFTHPAREAFEAIKTAIDDACLKKNDSIAFQAAEREGLTKSEDTSDVTRTIFKFDKVWNDGWELHLKFESYDTSRTFEMRPDINKFALELKEPVTHTHTNSFES